MSAPGIPTPPPGVRSSGGKISRAAVERVILILVIAGSLGAVWYSVGKLVKLQSQTKALNRDIAQLYADVDTMRSHWSGTRTQEVLTRFDSIPSTTFTGGAGIAEWTESIQRASVPLALETRFRLNGTQVDTNGPTNLVLTRVQATIEIVPTTAAPSTRPLYQRLVEWTREVAMQPRRVDLLELTINSSSPETATATATVELWAHDPSVNTAGAPAPATTNAAPATP